MKEGPVVSTQGYENKKVLSKCATLMGFQPLANTC
jgi:hypothetical protein